MLNLYSVRPKGFNIGNDAIFIALGHFIRGAFTQPFNLITLPATTRYESQRKGGLTAQTIYEINRNGGGVIVGGGNLYENNELEIDAVALQALSKPLMICSVSRGKVYDENRQLVDRTNVMPDDKIRLLHSRAQISLSRDIATTEYLGHIGCNTSLGGCPTLFMNEIPQHFVPMLGNERTDALISIRSPNLMSIPVRRQYETRDVVIQLLDLLKIKGYKNVKLLCHDHRDIEFANSIPDVQYFYTDDVYTYLTLLRNTGVCISFRLHAFLPCLSFDIPAINISYDQRSLSMMETIGMTDWNIDFLSDNVVNEVAYRLDNLGALHELTAKNRAACWPALRESLSQGFSRFSQLVTEQ
jgi:polysaccharide pyruvyl transferase WcaK-like protein